MMILRSLMKRRSEACQATAIGRLRGPNWETQRIRLRSPMPSSSRANIVSFHAYDGQRPMGLFLGMNGQKIRKGMVGIR